MPPKPTARRGIHDEKTATLPSPVQQNGSNSSDFEEDLSLPLKSNTERQSRSKSVEPQKSQTVAAEENTDDSPNETDDESSQIIEPNVKVNESIKESSTETDRLKQSCISNVAYPAIVIAVLAVAIGWYYYNQLTKIQPRPSCDDFHQLHGKYPTVESMLWPTLNIGVDRAINREPGEPSTFIFLYNSSTVAHSFLNDVTRIAINCFNSDDAIWRTSKDYNANEIAQNYNIVLDRYRKKLTSQGVMVVRDLDQVPPKAAKIFFTICDSHTPLVRRAIVFFTIDVSRQPRHVLHANRSATSIAEGILKDLWRSELHPNELDPLVVRLTESVFRID